MSSTIFFFIFIPFLAFVLLLVNLIFAPNNPYQEKESAFECGFHSFLGQNRTQFSISFFIFALLFLLFDLEILLVYPYIVSAYSNNIYGLLIMLIFFTALTIGLGYELGKKALNIDSRQKLSISSNKKLTGNFMPRALLYRAYDSLEWGLNSPPKPHSIVNLPLKNIKHLFNNIKIYLIYLKIFYLLINKKNLKLVLTYLWNLLSFKNFKLISTHVLNLLTLENFKLILKKIWKDKYLFISIGYISITHRIMPQQLAIKLGLLDYNFYTIYIGIIYAIICLLKACHKGFYDFSFKSFVCNIALGILIYNVFSSLLFLLSLYVVFHNPTCVYDSLKSVHEFFKNILNKELGIMYMNSQDRWAYYNVDAETVSYHMRRNFASLSELLTIPTSDVVRVNYVPRFSNQENFIRFSNEITRGYDKIAVLTQLRNKLNAFVLEVDAQFSIPQQLNRNVNVLQGPHLTRALEMLHHLNSHNNRYLNIVNNAYDADNTSLSMLRTWAQVKINNADARVRQSTLILHEIRTRGRSHGWDL